MAIFILEDVNYIEHYGLARARTRSGRCNLFAALLSSAHPGPVAVLLLSGAVCTQTLLLLFLLVSIALLHSVCCSRLLYRSHGLVGEAGFCSAVLDGAHPAYMLGPGGWTVSLLNYSGSLKRLPLACRLERTATRHSWNGNWLLTNSIVFRLQRHSDHHAHASRPYQVGVLRNGLSKHAARTIHRGCRTPVTFWKLLLL